MHCASERSWPVTTTVCLIVCWIALVSPLYVSAVRGRCLKKISSKNWREGEEHRETRVSLNCESGDIKWLSAKKRHLLTFEKGNEDLVVCLSVTKPGARVYRTKGTQRQLIAGVNDTGFLNCFQSECKHISFLFEVDDNYNGPKNLLYSYSGYVDIRCAECSETCQTDCLCSSEFAFHGKLVRSEFRINTYLHYFQVAEFVRYNNEYEDQILAHHAGRCQENSLETDTNFTTPNSTAISTTEILENEDTLLLEERITEEIPRNGTVRVIAKCPLKPKKNYFVSANLHFAPSGRPRLLMCCQHSDEHFAQAHLAHLVHRQECCRHV